MAENSYHFIGPVLKAIREHMKLGSKQMTFFIDHASIDSGHAEMVRRTIHKVARTRPDWEDIARTLEISLRLTENILADVFGQYEKLRAGKPSLYDFLNSLSPQEGV